VEVLAGSEIDSMFLKEFANGNSFYPDPVLRQQGDLDFLLALGFYQNTIPDILLKPAPRWWEKSFQTVFGGFGVCSRLTPICCRFYVGNGRYA
jgi:hypothetical protein